MTGVGQDGFSDSSLTVEKRGEQNICVDHNVGSIHGIIYSPKRCLFLSHQPALISSDNCEAACSVSLLCRAMPSARSQATKSLICSGDMPSVGILICTTPSSVLTSIMNREYIKLCGPIA